MLQEERQYRILSELASIGGVKVTDLALRLGTSESTIRRDINELDRAGKLKKVFGGAVSIEKSIKTVEEDMEVKYSVHVREKESIASYAARLVTEDDFVFMDAGSTTELMIDFLSHSAATFVTNGIVHGQKLAKRGFKVYLTGGQLKKVNLSIIGAEAVSFLHKCNFTKCFMGVDGIDAVRGYSTPDFDEALLKSEAMSRSETAYVLADESKFGCISAATFGNLADAYIITDRLRDTSFRKYTLIKEVEER